MQQKHQRDPRSLCPDGSTRSVDTALSLLRPVVGQREEKPIFKSAVRSSISWVRDTLTRTSRKHWWLHRTIWKWPRISCESLSPFPPPLISWHSTLLVPGLLSFVLSPQLWLQGLGLHSPKPHCLQHRLQCWLTPYAPLWILTGWQLQQSSWPLEVCALHSMLFEQWRVFLYYFYSRPGFLGKHLVKTDGGRQVGVEQWWKFIWEESWQTQGWWCLFSFFFLLKI